MGTFGDNWGKLKSKPLFYNILLILCVMLLIALTAHFTMRILTRHGSHKAVPDFAGMYIDEAFKIADEQGLRIQINDSLYIPAYEGGVVLDQLPERGVEVKSGRTIYITINASTQKMVRIPYVAGRSLRQAKNMLETAGLGIDRLVYQPDMATNYVLEEYYDGKLITPGSKREAAMGSGITLYVGVNDGKITAVPKVAGLYLREAKSRIWESGLNIGEILFDEGINLLNQKDAKVYLQTPNAGVGSRLGVDVSLRLTLDVEKVNKGMTSADHSIKNSAAELRRMEAEAAEMADSLARAMNTEDVVDGEVTTDSDTSIDSFFE